MFHPYCVRLLASVEREGREVFVRQIDVFVRNIFESDIDIKDLPNEVPDDKADEPDSAKEVAIVNDLQSNVNDNDLMHVKMTFPIWKVFP